MTAAAAALGYSPANFDVTAWELVYLNAYSSSCSSFYFTATGGALPTRLPFVFERSLCCVAHSDWLRWGGGGRLTLPCALLRALTGGNGIWISRSEPVGQYTFNHEVSKLLRALPLLHGVVAGAGWQQQQRCLTVFPNHAARPYLQVGHCYGMGHSGKVNYHLLAAGTYTKANAPPGNYGEFGCLLRHRAELQCSDTAAGPPTPCPPLLLCRGHVGATGRRLPVGWLVECPQPRCAGVCYAHVGERQLSQPRHGRHLQADAGF